MKKYKCIKGKSSGKRIKLFVEINKKDVIDFNIDKCIRTHLLNNKFVSNENSKLTILNTFFSKKHKMPNVCRFILKKVSGKYELIEHKNKSKKFKNSCFIDQDLFFKNELPAIVLVLESPHDKEYNNKTFEPKAPAQQDTGDIIFEKLEKVINTHNKKLLKLDKEEYRVIIINPIPYQTSLFHIHQQPLQGVYATLRNNVWKALWKNDNTYKVDLKKIIHEVNPEIVINACTATLSKFVKLELSDLDYNKYSKFIICHPSSWKRSDKNMILHLS